MADVGQTCEFPPRFLAELKQAAAVIKGAKSVTVISHIDADGITAGSIAAETLRRLGKDFDLVFEPKITAEVIARVNSDAHDLVWICDLGSAYMSEFTRAGIIVTDHHMPDTRWRRKQSSLDAFCACYHLNPHLYGVSGTDEVCGAGMTYLLSKTVDPSNRDLAHLAVVGAIGDFQDSKMSKLISWNRNILQDAVDAGDVAVSETVRYFGRGTRPLVQFLQYGEPAVPGITGDPEACMGLLSEYNIPVLDGNGKKRSWSDLDIGEMIDLTEELRNRLARDEDKAALYGEVYTIMRYSLKSGLGDAKEFATTLNSCGRYDDAPTGARICRGDFDALADAERNRRDHRRNISTALAYVKENHLLIQGGNIQFFDAGDKIRDTVVGIVAGMVLSSSDAAPNKPIIAFAIADDGVKVSARAPKSLVDRGLDLSKIMCDAASAVGGMGGGHTVAAGATIPEGKKEVFLEKVGELIASQISP